MTVMLNGYRYSAEIVELMDMAYMYAWRCTKQAEKYRDIVGWEISFDVLLSKWCDLEAAYNLLREMWGSEFDTNMNDYIIELRRKGNE